MKHSLRLGLTCLDNFTKSILILKFFLMKVKQILLVIKPFLFIYNLLLYQYYPFVIMVLVTLAYSKAKYKISSQIRKKY